MAANKPSKPTGGTLYHGPSAINGADIVAVVTYDSGNPKTGDMAQLWILDAGDTKPSDLVKQGRDQAVCGDCAFAGGKGCYVNTGQAPNAVYRTWQAGKYPEGVENRRKAIRLGAYGDPAALPYDDVAALLDGYHGWTGYTHQWKTCDQRFSGILMASVDNEAEYDQALRMGWRAARVGTTATLAGEIICPATAEGGYRTTCENCKLCSGTATRAKNILFPAHGSKKAKALIQIGAAA